MRHAQAWIAFAALVLAGLPAQAQGGPDEARFADLAFKACAYESALNNMSFRINPTFFRSLVTKACSREIEALGTAHPGQASLPKEAVDRIVREYERTLINMRQGSF